MERFVAVVKQYPGQQQVDLAVEIEVPGSWFGAGPMGSLTATEQREKYKAQAVEYAEVHEFPGATKGARKTREKAIRFICITLAITPLRQLTGQPVYLIETLAQQIAARILGTFTVVKAVTVEVNKPFAPVAAEFDAISVKIRRERA